MIDATNVPSARIRIGAVSYFNTKPLTDGLGADPRIELSVAVPSRLPEQLESGQVDVALVPTIEIARAGRDWSVISDACIGCDGATLTVRVFSRVDPSDITVLHVDGDSRSSVALASVIWSEKFNRELILQPFDVDDDHSVATLDTCEAVLLIGDKVIRPPVGLDGFSTQVDLGATWKSMTGLPFVFAVWATPRHDLPAFVDDSLRVARDRGVARAADIAAKIGPEMGWPVDLARKYLTSHLSFTMTERHRLGMNRFLDLAKRHHLTDTTSEPSAA